MSSTSSRNQRSDARRSRARILEAAIRVLNRDPEASLETIAASAGVTRQTVYAHFPSRHHLLTGVLDRITEEAVAAMDAAALDRGSAEEALWRLLEASTRTFRHYPVLVQKLASLPVDPQEDRARHEPVTARLQRVIERGQQAGEFDDRLSTGWLVAVTVRLGHLASEEAEAGRMSEVEAAETLRLSLLRVLGVCVERGAP